MAAELSKLDPYFLLFVLMGVIILFVKTKDWVQSPIFRKDQELRKSVLALPIAFAVIAVSFAVMSETCNKQTYENYTAMHRIGAAALIGFSIALNFIVIGHFFRWVDAPRTVTGEKTGEKK